MSDAAPAATGKPNLDQPTSTGSRLGLTARETPATVTVVDRATIDARGAQTTQEILRAIPGITAHDAPGSTTVRYRGFAGNAVNQLFNGINLEYSSANRLVDSWIYDRVEAIGGPSSFLFGSGGVGGSVNYITKVAERSDFSEAQVRAGTRSLRDGSFGLARRIAGDGGSGNSHFARIDVNHRDAGSWTQGTESRATQIAASLLSDLGGGLTHLLAAENQDEHVDRPYWGTPLKNPVAGRLQIDPATRFQNYNSADGVYAQRVRWLRSVTDWRASDRLQLKNTLYGYDGLRDFRNVETYRFNAANTAVIRSAALLQRHDQQVFGNRIDGVLNSEVAGRKSDWSFGLDVGVNRQTRFPNSLPATVSTVNPVAFSTENFFDIPGLQPGFSPDRNNRTQTTAVYLENRTFVAPRWSVLTALRHERIALELTNRRAVNAANPATFARDYRATTGRIGVVWDVAPGANLYVQYATAADPPSGSLTAATFAEVINNSDLTTGTQAEVGTKLDFWSGKGSATLAAYSITRKNISSQDPNNSLVTLLVGEQSSKGVEMVVGVQPSRRWSLQANLTYVDAQYERFATGGVSFAGKTPTNIPRSVANLWAGYAITPALQATVGVRRVGSVFADAANTQTWGSYTLVDLGLAYQVNQSISVVGRVRNATDRVYAATVSSMAYLGAPRTADLALRAAF